MLLYTILSIGVVNNYKGEKEDASQALYQL